MKAFGSRKSELVSGGLRGHEGSSSNKQKKGIKSEEQRGVRKRKEKRKGHLCRLT
jgi:hypothetical protein